MKINVALLAILASHFLQAQDFNAYKKEFFIRGADILRYRILYTENYKKEDPYPLVVFLHGAGERGTGNSLPRDKVHKGKLEKFENLLSRYYQSDKPQTIGLPSVAYCAGELNLSAGYFGDLIKKETGMTAQEYIQAKVIDIAKEKIFDAGKSISQVAYELGFRYP